MFFLYTSPLLPFASFNIFTLYLSLVGYGTDTSRAMRCPIAGTKRVEPDRIHYPIPHLKGITMLTHSQDCLLFTLHYKTLLVCSVCVALHMVVVDLCCLRVRLRETDALVPACVEACRTTHTQNHVTQGSQCAI